MTADPHQHEHVHEAGPWLDDARRILTLIESVGQQYGQQHGQQHGQQFAQATRTGPVQAGECAWCPLCQALSVARRSAPDLLDRFAELATGLAATIRATQSQAAPEPSADPAPPTDVRAAPPETVRIDITD